MAKSKLEKLHRLLYETCIDYTAYGPTTTIDTAAVVLLPADDGFWVFGAGYIGVWSYSAEYAVRMLDRKFREGMGA